MSTTTLSRYKQKDASTRNPLEDTQNTDFTQVACYISGEGDRPDSQNREIREKLIRDHIEGSDDKSLKSKLSRLFKNQ